MPNYIGVTHFQEVAFVFDNIHNYGYGEPISALPFENRGPAYIALAKLMDQMWISFIHDLDPNNNGSEYLLFSFRRVVVLGMRLNRRGLSNHVTNVH